MRLNIYQLVFSMILISCPLEASYFRTIDYDEVRKEGGFSSSTLYNVSHLMPAGDPLTVEEKEELVKSSNLFNLRTLDLTGQNINDEFIKSLCNNQNLRRIINIDISNNQNVTDDSIDSILNSAILGSIRDLPQISGRYGIPSSTIYVKAKQTAITGKSYFEKHVFGFNINYLHPVYNRKTSEAVEDGVKFVEVTLN